jgi:nicotinate-nucleotide adenylyltransferase
MRLGILGGTFDPVHFGHLLLAETCRQQLGLSQVRLIPAGQPPHKPQQRITDGHARADMLSFAVAGYPEFIVDRREIRRNGPSWTVETLTELHSEFPDAELFFLMGADSVQSILTWREPQRIAELAWIVACNRPGCEPLTDEEIARDFDTGIAKRIVNVSIPGTDLSATELRDRVRHGLGLRFMTPRAVEAYIDQNGLYR